MIANIQSRVQLMIWNLRGLVGANSLSSGPLTGGMNTPDDLDRFVGWVDPSYPIEFIGLMKKLALTVPDLSQAVKRQVHLANTGLEVSLVGASDDAKDRAKVDAKHFFDDHPGIVNRLLRQAALTGAVSVESIPSLDLDTVVENRLVPVDRVRFRRVLENGIEQFLPYQITRDGKQVQLNTAQYFFEAVEQDEDSPYAIPPMIAAIRNIYVQMSGNDNIAGLFDKLNLMGFVSAQRKPPRPMPGENPKEYSNRLERELKIFAEAAAPRIKKGLMFSYDDTTVQHTNVTGDTRGFESIWRSNEEQLASGMNIDPSLLGRTYSTTETYAGVIYEAFLAQLGSIRDPAERALKRSLDLYFRLLGYKFERVSIQWRRDKALNPAAESTARLYEERERNIKFQRLISMRNEGIIDQQTVAEEMGYEEPDQKTPPPPRVASPLSLEECSCGNPSSESLSLQRVRLGDLDQQSAEELDRIFEEYDDQLVPGIREIRDEMLQALESEISNQEIGEISIDDMMLVVRSVYQRFAGYQEEALTSGYEMSWKSGNLVDGTSLRASGRGTRLAGTISQDWSNLPVPEDALRWFVDANKTDITGVFASYETEIREAIVTALETGDREAAIQSLRETLPSQMFDDPILSDRLSNIFRNFASRAQNFSRTKRLEVMGAKSAEYVAVIDNRTSAICIAVDGKSVEIKTLSSFVDRWIETPYDDNFWNTFKNPSDKKVRDSQDEWNKLTGDEIARRLGAPVPPLHFKCRTTLVISG